MFGFSARSDLQSECLVMLHSDYKSERASVVLEASKASIILNYRVSSEVETQFLILNFFLPFKNKFML